MAKRYVVRLEPEEREQLRQMIRNGRIAAYKRRHAEVLLKADAGEGRPGWTDVQIAEAFEVSVRSIEHIRQRFVVEGLEAALNRRKQRRPSVEPKLDGEKEARLIAMSCSAPPNPHISRTSTAGIGKCEDEGFWRPIMVLVSPSHTTPFPPGHQGVCPSSNWLASGGDKAGDSGL